MSARTSAPKKKKQNGRPTKLRANAIAHIVEAMEAGATYEAAATYAGITYQTYLNWMERGRAETSGIYFEFFGTVEQANARAQVLFAQRIQKASKDDWRAAAWMLERRYPKAYGARIGAIDEKVIDDTIESELARLAALREKTAAGTAETTGDDAGTKAT